MKTLIKNSMFASLRSLVLTERIKPLFVNLDPNKDTLLYNALFHNKDPKFFIKLTSGMALTNIYSTII